MRDSVPITISQRAVFIPHDGRSRTEPIDLPSRCRISHRPTVQIQELVALSYGIHPKHMVSREQTQPTAWIRQIAMYLTRELTNRSLPEIGRAFGGRDHTTVIHAIRRVKKRMSEDCLVADDIAALRKALRA